MVLRKLGRAPCFGRLLHHGLLPKLRANKSVHYRLSHDDNFIFL